MYAWDEPGVGKFVTFMAIEGVFYFCLVFIYELGWFRKFVYLLRKKKIINVVEDGHLAAVSMFKCTQIYFVPDLAQVYLG